MVDELFYGDHPILLFAVHKYLFELAKGSVVYVEFTEALLDLSLLHSVEGAFTDIQHYAFILFVSEYVEFWCGRACL